jgi:hypothetical protein
MAYKGQRVLNAAAPHVMVEFSLGIPQDRLSRMTDDYEDWDAQEQLA